MSTRPAEKGILIRNRYRREEEGGSEEVVDLGLTSSFEFSDRWISKCRRSVRVCIASCMCACVLACVCVFLWAASALREREIYAPRSGSVRLSGRKRIS